MRNGKGFSGTGDTEQGLPGQPGLDAIDATVHPADHDYYFFLHKPTEETVLSRTFAEHLAAKRRYLD